MLDDTDARFVYSGSGWQTTCLFGCPAGDYMNTLHSTSTTGNTATITLYGNQMRLYAAKTTLSGIAGVAIDGGAETNVDLYASSFPGSGNQLVWSSGLLPWASHTLTIRNTGTRNIQSAGNSVSVDRLDVSTP